MPVGHLQILTTHLATEDSPIVLELFYKIMHKAQTTWLPQSLGPLVNKLMAEFFLDKAYSAPDDDTQLQVYCVTRAVDFMFDDPHLMMIVDWFLLHNSHIVVKGKVLATEISSELAYSLLRKTFKSADLNPEQEELLFDEVF